MLLDVKVADTEDLRAVGLQFQEPLPSNEGMLFVYDKPKKQSLWMLRMIFSIDMLWMDTDGNVVHIEKNVPPCDKAPCDTYKNKSNDAKYILEVTAGFVEKNKITKDSKMEILEI